MTKKESMKKARMPSPATSLSATSLPVTSLPATAMPCNSLPATVSSSTEVDTTPTSLDNNDYMLLNLDEGFEVIEDGDFDDDDDMEVDNHVPATPGSEQQPRMRRRKTTNIILPEETERALAEWLEFDVPFIYDKGDPRHKQKEHVEKVWLEKAASLTPPLTSQDLKTWFTSLRSRFGRLSKEQSSGGSRRMTGREKWILAVFKFLKPHIVRHRKSRTIGIPMSAANPERAPTPVTDPAAAPGPSPVPDTDDVYDLSASSQEDTSPAISKPVCRVKKRKSGGSVPVVMTQGTLEQVLETVQKVRHNLGGVMDVVEEPELKYWRTSLESMAKDCVGLPSSYNTALKMELLAAIHRFRNAQEEGVAKPGPDLMLHMYQNFSFPTPQSQAQQQHPPMATTVPGVQAQQQHHPMVTTVPGIQGHQQHPPMATTVPGIQGQQQHSPMVTTVPGIQGHQQHPPMATTVPGIQGQQQHPPMATTLPGIQGQQHHPPMATTVPGVHGQPVLYHGTPASTLPTPLVTQPKPALVTLPAHQASALQTLLHLLSAATPTPTHLPPGASPTK